MAYVVEVVHLGKPSLRGSNAQSSSPALQPSTTRFEAFNDADRYFRWAVGDLVLRAEEGFELLGVSDPQTTEPTTTGVAGSARFSNDRAGVRTEVLLRIVDESVSNSASDEGGGS